MLETTTVIIGAGQAGLAMSRCLTDRSIDHVLLERGSGRKLLAHRALGFTPAPHAQLDDAPARRQRMAATILMDT